MSVDISLYIQRRRTPNDEWELDPSHTFSTEGGIREVDAAFEWTAMFGHLAGVRLYIKPIAHGRGLPDDMPEDLLIQAQDQDSHDHNWCTLRELEKAVARAIRDGWAEGESLKKWLAEKDCTEVFFDWRDHQNRDWPGYDSLIRYCRRWIMGTKIENNLLDIKTDLNKPQIRFIFWFNS